MSITKVKNNVTLLVNGALFMVFLKNDIILSQNALFSNGIIMSLICTGNDEACSYL
jgi:hypothetical protein